MSKFIFVMQHAPTAEQLTAASEGEKEVVQLNDKKLLIVPDDKELGKDWFLARAEAIASAIGGFSAEDTAQVMGQPQLASAVQALAKKAGATLVESVTPRVSRDIPQEDGTVKKENIFSFSGFRIVHQY